MSMHLISLTMSKKKIYCLIKIIVSALTMNLPRAIPRAARKKFTIEIILCRLSEIHTEEIFNSMIWLTKRSVSTLSTLLSGNDLQSDIRVSRGSLLLIAMRKRLNRAQRFARRGERLIIPMIYCAARPMIIRWHMCAHRKSIKLARVCFCKHIERRYTARASSFISGTARHRKLHPASLSLSQSFIRMTCVIHPDRRTLSRKQGERERDVILTIREIFHRVKTLYTVKNF